MSVQHFTSKQIKKIASREEYNGGVYMWKVTSAKKLAGDTAPEGFQIGVAALTDPNDVESAHRMTYTVRLPLGPTEESGPVPTFQLRQAAEFATVLFEDLDGIPTWNREERRNEIFGEEVAKSEVEAKTEAGIEAALNKLVDVYEQGEEAFVEAFVGKCFGMELARSKPNADGRRYLNSRRLFKVIPEGVELVAKENFVYQGSDDAEEAINDTPAKITPAKKKTATKARR
jgi:hypothetical protein